MLNNDLADIGTIYATSALTITNVPAKQDVSFISLKNLPKGRYVVTVMGGTTAQIIDGGIMSLRSTGRDGTLSVMPNSPLNNPNFIGNGSVSGIITITADVNTIEGYIYLNSAHTMQYGRLEVIRIS